jgi:hypothetical protein
MELATVTGAKGGTFIDDQAVALIELSPLTGTGHIEQSRGILLATRWAVREFVVQADCRRTSTRVFGLFTGKKIIGGNFWEEMKCTRNH